MTSSTDSHSWRTRPTQTAGRTRGYRRLSVAVPIAIALLAGAAGSTVAVANAPDQQSRRSPVAPAQVLRAADTLARAETVAAAGRFAAPFRTPDAAALQAAKARAAQNTRQAAPAAQRGPTTSNAPLVTVVINWLGLTAADQGGTVTPPDTTGSIGPAHYVEFVNRLVGVYDRTTGGLLAQMDLATFVGAPGVNAFDPQIQYDALTDRWYYVADVITGPTTTFLVLGSSKTGDPSDLTDAGWCKYAIGTGTNFNDYPKLGHDNNGVSIGTNVFNNVTGAFITADIWSISKGFFLDPACPGGTVFHFADAASPLLNQDGTRAFTPVPANTADSSAVGYIVAAHLATGGPQNRIMAWFLDAAPAVPQLFQVGDLPVTAYAIPPNAPQPGSAALLDTLDARLTQAVAVADPDAGGATAVWTQHTIAGGGGSKVRWYEFVLSTSTVRQQGDVETTTEFVFNGAISPSILGNDAAINYNIGSSTMLPAIQAQSRQGTTPLGTMDPGAVTLGTSVDPDQDFSCVPPRACRWGDYAGASPDPIAPGLVWGSNQVSGPFNAGNAQWQTYNFGVATAP